MTFTAYIEYDPATKLFTGTIPPVRGAHSQGATLDELQQNLKEVLLLCLDEEDERGLELQLKFIGTEHVEEFEISMQSVAMADSSIRSLKRGKVGPPLNL